MIICERMSALAQLTQENVIVWSYMVTLVGEYGMRTR